MRRDGTQRRDYGKDLRVIDDVSSVRCGVSPVQCVICLLIGKVKRKCRKMVHFPGSALDKTRIWVVFNPPISLFGFKDTDNQCVLRFEMQHNHAK